MRGIPTVAALALLSMPALALGYMHFQAQTTPYLVSPTTRPPLRGSSARKGGIAPVPPAKADAGLQAARREILDAVNRERAKRKLPLIKQNAKLDLAAQRHADDMLRRKFFSHRSPDGTTPEGRTAAVGYFAPPCDCSYSFTYGENIANGQKTSADVMKAWMQSTIHRGNILKPGFLELGVGSAGGYWVQNFGGVHIDR